MKASLIGKFLLSGAAFGGAFALFAADYNLAKDGSNTEAMFGGTTAYWTPAAGGEAVNQVTSDDDCYVASGRTFVASSLTPTFPGKALHIGDSAGSSSGKMNFRSNFTCTNFCWHAGDLIMGTGGSVHTLSEGTVFLDSATAHAMLFSTATPSSSAGWSLGILSALRSGSEAVLTVRLASKASGDPMTGKGVAIDAQHYLSCDNTAFQGKVLIEKYGYLALGHAAAAGAPATPVADKITLGDHGRLSVGKNVVPNANCGITIAGEDARLVAKTYQKGLTDCTDFTLPMPIVGSKGLAKYGSGNVTLQGTYSAGPLEVAEGTLTLGESASVTPGLAVTVRSGATFVQKVFVSGIAVTTEGTGTYVKDYSIVVPYDKTTDATTPLDFTAGIPESPLSLSLSEKIDVPCHAGKDLVVAWLSPDSALTSADFADGTEKTCGLPKTHFEIRTQGDRKVLALVANRTVVSQKAIVWDNGNGHGVNGAAGDWSLGDSAQPGYDYLLQYMVDGLGEAAFAGDSLTFGLSAAGAAVTHNLRHAVSTVGHAVAWPGTTFQPNHGSYKTFSFSEGSSLEVPDDGTGNTVTFMSRKTGAGGAMTIDLNLPLTGRGTVRLISNSAPARTVKLTGENGAFLGRFVVAASGSGTDTPNATNSTVCLVKDAMSLGGPLADPTEDALKLENYALLSPQSSMTLETVNRGISIASAGFRVDEGLSLTVREPVRLSGQLHKWGAGLLSLGGSLTRSGATRFYVHEGAVKVLSDAAVAGLPVRFSAGARLLLDAAAGTANGLTGGIDTEAGVSEVSVALAPPPPAFADSQFSIPICTVPTTHADLSDVLVLAPARGFAGTIEKTNVTVDDVACVRYAARYVRKGSVIFLR